MIILLHDCGHRQPKAGMSLHKTEHGHGAPADIQARGD